MLSLCSFIEQQREPSTLDISQSSQGSASMSLLSFQHHENELLEASPWSSSRVTRSEGQLRVTQSLASTTRVRVTQSAGQVKVIPQTTTSQQGKDPLDGSRTSHTGVTGSEGQVKVTHHVSRSSSHPQTSTRESSGGHDKDPDGAASVPGITLTINLQNSSL